MNERIKQIISTAGIKKAEFARRINVSPPFVSELCSGVKSPSDRTISDICRVFNVSERWLRTGNGEMFTVGSEDEDLEQIFAAISASDDDLIKRIIRAYWRLSEAEKATVRKLIDSIATEAESPQEDTAQTSVEEAEAAYIKSRLEAVRRTEPSVSNISSDTTAG